MKVTITDTRITVEAQDGWTDEEWDWAMKAHGIYDETVHITDYRHRNDTHTWVFTRTGGSNE